MVMIDHGRLVFDGALEELKRRFGEGRVLVVDFSRRPQHLDLPGARLIRQEANRAWLRVDATHRYAAAADRRRCADPFPRTIMCSISRWKSRRSRRWCAESMRATC